MLHSYQVLTVVRMEQERQLARWHLVQAARETSPRAGQARFGTLRGADLGFLSRRLSRRRPTVGATACC